MSDRPSKLPALIFAVVGAAAAVAGAWWSTHSAPSQATVNAATPAANTSATGATPQAAASTTVASDALPADFWTQTFDTPDGKTLKLADHKGHPILLNFWASWCPPCVKEMPDIDHFHRDMQPKGWHVIGLAVDGPTPVREFLAKVPVGFDIGLAGFGGTELSQALGNTAGGLPFTVLIGADGRILHRKVGGTTYADLKAWAAGH
ncbi:MAG: redoxin family protein [Burkholderiales bacterium]|nr:redoxin family protein [Burkholderiales bacterium]